MRDKDNNVIVGKIDDIREVTYTVALTKHPDPEQPGLDYPWQVKSYLEQRIWVESYIEEQIHGLI